MKKIVPFNNLLTFETDVCEITSISLEHDIKKEKDIISGIFYITGDYKMTDGQLDRLNFKFDLPFDIALSQPYNLDTLDVDIDDFRYELVDKNKLKVNIDLYIDGEVIEEPIDYSTDFRDLEEELTLDEDKIHNDLDKLNLEDTKEENFKEKEELLKEKEELLKEKEELTEQISSITDIERLNDNELDKLDEDTDLLDEMLNNKEETNNQEETNTKEVEEAKIDINNNNENINVNTNNNENIFSNLKNDTNYVTYKVYRVVEGDNIDSIIKKYNISREELASYNDLENVIPGTKLIIPAND